MSQQCNQLNSFIPSVNAIKSNKSTQLRGTKCCFFLWQRQHHPTPSPHLMKPSNSQTSEDSLSLLTSRTTNARTPHMILVFLCKILAGWEHMVYRATFSAFKSTVETKSQSCNSSPVNPKKYPHPPILWHLQ